MPKVFISHAWEDNDFSRKLAKHLRDDGAETWLYYTKVAVDGRLPKVFEEAIDWCDKFILVWSESASKSPSVILEWQKAHSSKKMIIPCLLDDTKQSDILRNQYYINFFKFDHGYDNLINILNLNSKIKVDKAEKNIEEDLSFSGFRADPAFLSEDEVVDMVVRQNLFDMKRNVEAPGFKNQFELINIRGDKILIDHNSDLTWQQGGSTESMWLENAKNWIADLNKSKFHDYTDWRLPTLEEAMTLLRPKRNDNNLYVDPFFDKRQYSIWTSDSFKNPSQAWVVFFNCGSCHINYPDFNNFVRAVRSNK